MPHSTGSNGERSSGAQDFQHLGFHDEQARGKQSRPHSPINNSSRENRHPRRENHISWTEGSVNAALPRHGRQRSLSDAIKHIHSRRGSVTANAQEIADALKAPVSPKLIILCIIWYMTSALTNTSSKSILTAFPKPATLTLIQFSFVSGWCLLFDYVAQCYPSLRVAIPALKHGIRRPSREVIMTTLPLAAFQVGGHLLSSTATSKIPVSLVHTIKGMSPLFTVLAYRFVFRVHYSLATYLSLIPLTLGVMLACSAEFKGNIIGIFCALGGAIIFVTQNIFSKKLFNEASRAEADGQYQQSRKLDKLNLLCYSSGLAFVLTAPLWIWSEGLTLLGDFFHDGALDLPKGGGDTLGPERLALEFVFNGTFHFGQNIIAFILLSIVSPVTYSVASLIKRVFVIVVAIVWFGNRTSNVQAIGIALTFLGLYLYDRTSDSTKEDRRVKLQQFKNQNTLLPLSTSPLSSPSSAVGAANSFTNIVSPGEKKMDTFSPNKINMDSWLPPGTRQEDTWRPRDMAVRNSISVS
ncbi:MAG: suppressor of loss of ypt1 [Geoglossum umbratile]|nr:MAG: suppressor of loss of ypt1 [Geoglossum umbratile]